MAKASGGKGSASSNAPPARKSGSGDVVQQAKSSVKGNGNRTAQAELDLTVEAPEEDAQADEPVESAATPAVSRAEPAGAGEPALAGPAAPAMRELGLTRKELWKVDLKGKRIALDEKAWREELARALGRVPAKP